MSNDDDLYGDLYGGAEPEYPDFGGDELDTNDPSLTASTDTAAKTSGPSKATTADAQSTEPVAKTDVSASVAKRLEPATNPIPTFTEESSYTVNTGSRQGGTGESGVNSQYRNLSEVQHIEALDTSKPNNLKDEGKMFVGGLNWDTSDEGLRSYFSQFGKVEACTIMRDPQGRSRGFAFLTFEDPAAVNKVMVQEHFLDGKIIDPKRAIPRTEHQRTVKMFVGGLAPSVTNDTMRDYFSQFGKVIDCTVMVDRDSSRSKGFGFVTFDDQSGAERLFGMPGLQIDGKTIEVKQAQPRSGMATDRNNNNNMGNNNNHRGGAPAYGNNNFNSNAAAAGNTPFDPQALATLYQRMAQLTGAAQGGMGWNMGTGMGMNPAMGGMGMMNGGMMGAGMMGAGGGGGMGMGGGMRNGGMNNGMGGMGGNDGRANGMGGHSGTAPMRGGNIPRGPAAMRGGMQGGGGGGGMMGVPTGPSGGLGPARMGRGHQHNYHPYSR